MKFKDLTYKKAGGKYFIDDCFNGIQFKGYVLLDSSSHECKDCIFKDNASLDCFYI